MLKLEINHSRLKGLSQVPKERQVLLIQRKVCIRWSGRIMRKRTKDPVGNLLTSLDLTIVLGIGWTLVSKLGHGSHTDAPDGKKL